MRSRKSGRLVLFLVAVFGLLSLSASGGSGMPDPRGNGYREATFYVA